MTLELRLATANDLERVEPLVADYHRFENIDSLEVDRKAALGRLLAEPALGGLWKIEVDGELAGYIVLCRGFSIEFNGFDAFIDEFFLLPGFRGQGIGRRVLEQIADEAGRLDINALHLEVARDNEAAQRLYRASGFKARDKYLLMSRELGED